MASVIIFMEVPKEILYFNWIPISEKVWNMHSQKTFDRMLTQRDGLTFYFVILYQILNHDAYDDDEWKDNPEN